jgi:hypothetical protein
MFSPHYNRQLTVASVLLLLLAAFAVDPPDHRCRTQSTRNRQSRIVRLDDSDSHTRWHNHGSDNSGRNVNGDALVAVAENVFALNSEFAAERIAPEQEAIKPFEYRTGALRSRPPPSAILT